MSLRDLEISQIVELALNGNRRAVGRLLTHVERGGAKADEITQLTHGRSGDAHIIGITGAPGAGKSTLTGRLLHLLAAESRRAAVLAVDPSSPLTGGAILGDRIRMDTLAGETAFIRSVATRGHAGGLALSVPGCVRVFVASGFDPVIIETVGVGQVEVDVVGAADTTVVVVTPGWGDAVQANKAGLLEVADVFVINKADRSGASSARRDLELMLDLSHVSGLEDQSGYRPPIVMTTATDGDGVTDLWHAIDDHREHLVATGQLATRRAARLRFEVANQVAERLHQASAVAIEAADLTGDSSPTELATGIAGRLLRD